MKPIATYQKLRGGYYTPKPIADFLAQWVIQTPTTQVLEPSCGDGILLQAATETLLARGASPLSLANLLYGIEFDPLEATKAAERLNSISETMPPVPIHQGDFFSYCYTHLTDKRHFDAIIGNPPFVRYQNFPEEQRRIAFYLMQRAALHPNRLTNTWVPFLVAASLLLNPKGRLAMVIPAELLQVNYTAELRYFLSHYYTSITLITFKKLVFEGIQQEILLLLAERDGHEHTGIRTIELDGIADLVSLDHADFSTIELKEMNHSTEKWTVYFLDAAELELIRSLHTHPHLTLAHHVMDVDVGIVTGLNDFFVLTEQQVAQHSLQSHIQPLVGRSAHVQGLRFTTQDWEMNAARQVPAFLLRPPDVPFSLLSDNLKEYIATAEAQGLHKGYKCRIRQRWYVVPSVWTPHAFMLRQIHHYPKIILNDAMATCTDTIHRVKFKHGISARNVAGTFLNSLTFAFAEITGRSYGGGVLELEPNEAEKLPLPLTGAEQLDLDELDRLLRAGDIYSVLDITDKLLLHEIMGLSYQEIQQLRSIWEKLRDRRVNRKLDASVKKVATTYR
jgi:adenine-specific DNA-methyltransferase